MRQPELGRDLPMLALLAAAVVGVMVVGGMTTASAIPDWYSAIRRPSWTPPNWVFGPAWTLLYALMTIAAWMVWRRRRLTPIGAAMAAWWIQLAFNLGWTLLFFGLRRPDLALAEIALLWLAIAATLFLFWRVRPLAGLLLVPYLAWVSYAASLNGGIVALN